jgi:hypothetical protein
VATIWGNPKKIKRISHPLHPVRINAPSQNAVFYLKKNIAFND